MDNKYLLEIGVEELPARLIGSALEQLKNNTKKMLNEERIQFEGIETYATPRRLVLIIEGLGDKQETIQELVKGPAKRIAYDDKGNPTKALHGFMNGQGVEIDQIIIQEYNGEEYIYANVIKEGKTTETILSENMANIIKSIIFPKSMKWGGKNIRFARPIRWLVSLYNENVLPFNLEGIEAGNITKGHRFLGSNHIELKSVDEYFETLEKNYVLVDQNRRKDIIKYGSERLAKEKGGNLLMDSSLLEEVTYIVEYPTPLIGRIEEEYLNLPIDVIITPMKEHLRYFPVVDDKGRLLPYFITVRNGNEEHIDTVTKGNEKVLGARLEDAKFFYYEDIKTPLEDYVEDLKNITFQEKLGTLFDKTIRIQKLAAKIGNYLEVGQETKNNIERAAYLSKADLVTKMVDEFTELQGNMGMEYAKQSGENEIVSLAIYEQYLPRFAEDQLPTTTAGAILSIADKLDTIAGCFAIGIQPTGSQDPYGLRRQALGIINVILDRKLNLNLGDIIDFALYIYVDENSLVFNYENIKSEILEFFNGRIKNMFSDVGIRYDIIDGVINTGIDDVYDLKLRADKLNEYLNEEGLTKVLATFNRVINLAEKASSTEIKRDLLVEEEEIELYEAFNSIEDKVLNWLNKKEYDKALEQFIVLREPVDNFFDHVMVMVDDDEIRGNRLSLLAKISETMLMICDLSKIVK
ncbi:glycine--tRNA ligase subunit beta [Clostridium sp. Cult3]|uniref:glycine--tRNA ligase subunit beta n=1 Tax=Clostridium sp. Cult3 TaxID=2079004 RepID=UPI001F029FFB|nr:glycine--tRNA ligase subunit beta [Clostridium sp. Cult3]MCF6461066.1 glycine--tRNA ligase subunit beta [Clostridium sp. Cult3]